MPIREAFVQHRGMELRPPALFSFETGDASTSNPSKADSTRNSAYQAPRCLRDTHEPQLPTIT